MTLTKVKPRHPTPAHKQRVGLHHRHSHLYLEAYWPYLPIMLISVFRILVRIAGLSQRTKSVLGLCHRYEQPRLAHGTNS